MKQRTLGSCQFAPVALFVYRRTDLLRLVLKSLQACEGYSQSEVFLFSDGPKTQEAAADVQAVREILAELKTSNMTIVESPVNKGLAASIIDGATKLCNQYGRVIVLEDDLLLSPLTLRWFNTALSYYENTEQVMQISAYAFHSRRTTLLNEALFLPVPSSWGWATWSRAWNEFDRDAIGAEEALEDPSTLRSFDLHGAFKYSKMLKDQRQGLNDSWAIRWYWSMFRKEGLTLYPPVSFITNLGQDSKATHGSFLQTIRRAIVPKPELAMRLPKLPSKVQVEEKSYRAIRRVIKYRMF